VTIDKAALRALSREQRDAHAARRGDAAPSDLARHVLDTVPIPDGAAISGYWPMASEMDPRPLMAALVARGHRLCLPVVEARGVALIFRAWTPGDALVEAVFGTRVPTANQDVITPDVLLVPLLAFDRAGHRLGYGGGYYDRTLAAMSDPLAIGIAYGFQEVDKVPHAAHDQRLDWMVTELGAARRR
jgi:5-formyltetrahydrofolate cyclo-ligase